VREETEEERFLYEMSLLDDTLISSSVKGDGWDFQVIYPGTEG
jgi:hypothetical protein